MDDSTKPPEFMSSLTWSAMCDADVQRRYYGVICDRLRKRSFWIALTTWALSVGATLMAVLSAPVAWSVAVVVLAAGVATLRDVLRLPERVAEARYILMGSNREYDRMRLLWETRGRARPPAEYGSFERTSRLHDFTNEVADPEVLEAALKDSDHYHASLHSSPEDRRLPVAPPQEQ